MSDGAFDDAARTAIYGRSLSRCVGCGSPEITAQHRRARGMGGTSRVAIGHPANGLALCGSGTTGCHGWAEAEPGHALLLGWRLAPDADPVFAPYLDLVTLPGCPWLRCDPEGLVHVVDEDELSHPTARAAAVRAYRQHLARRV